MTTLLSLDGGNNAEDGRVSYVGCYLTGELIRVEAMTLEQARTERLLYNTHAVAVEMPDYLKSGVPPKVIFGLMWNVCRIAYTLALGAPVYEYTVNNGLKTDWIGTVAKPVLHGRIWSELRPLERACFPASTAADIDRAQEHHARTGKVLKSYPAFNTLDAAGVGLFHLGRIKKGGAKP